MSNGFSTTTTLATVNPSDPTKHVNYSLGMILGVDDLTQEFGYLTGHDQWLARDALGYGTLNGLSVTGSTAPLEPQVIVSAGTALMPSGKLVRVCANQCAQLRDWVTAHPTEIALKAPSGASEFDLQLYVVLCYTECLTDWVPVPGDSCRTEDDLQAPSRIADNFNLDLRLDPPQQPERDAIAHFAHWLARHVDVVASGGEQVSTFIDALRAAATPGDPYLNDASPAGVISINAIEVPALMRAVHRLWATELRPRWRPAWLGSGDSCTQSYVPVQPTDGDCLLLAQITLHVMRGLESGPFALRWQPANPPGAQNADRVIIVEDSQPSVTEGIALRPILASTGLLQELCTRLSGGVGLTGAVASGPLGITARAQTSGATSAEEGPTTLRGAADGPRSSVVAAGTVEVVNAATDAAGATPNAFNLNAATATADGVVNVTFAGPTEGPWVVQVMQVTDSSDRSYAISYDAGESANTKNGFALRVRNGIGSSARDVPRASLVGVKLMIQVSRCST